MGSRKRRQELDHESVVADWQQHAIENDDENFEFLRSLKRRNFGFNASDLAAELHRQAFKIVDCTRCANCCRTAIVKLDRVDIVHISASLGMGTQDFIEKYLEPDEQDGSFTMRHRALGKGKP